MDIFTVFDHFIHHFIYIHGMNLNMFDIQYPSLIMAMVVMIFFLRCYFMYFQMISYLYSHNHDYAGLLLNRIRCVGKCCSLIHIVYVLRCVFDFITK